MSEPRSTTIEVSWQYCRDGYDIGGSFYAEDDADTVRAWDGDFCLIEVTRVGDQEWMPTGGDGNWIRLDGHLFPTPADALAVYMDGQPYVIAD